MDSSFDEMAESLHDIANSERLRLEQLRFQVTKGYIAPPSDRDFQRWEDRVRHIEAAARALRALAPVEHDLIYLIR